MGDSSRLILVRRSFCRGSKLARHGRGRRGRTWGWRVRSKTFHVQYSSVIYGLHNNTRTRMQRRSRVVLQAMQQGLSFIGLEMCLNFLAFPTGQSPQSMHLNDDADSSRPNDETYICIHHRDPKLS